MRYVFDFGEDSGGGRELLGGKGVGLAEMTQLGVPCPTGSRSRPRRAALTSRGGEVPRASTQRSTSTSRASRSAPGRVRRRRDPLLVSVRSGAAISMPGMMDTILNLGLSDDAADGLAASTGKRAVRARLVPALVQMYGEVVDGRRSPFRAGAHQRAEGGAGASRRTGPDGGRPPRARATFLAVYEEETVAASRRIRASQLRRAYRAGLRVVERAVRAHV
jgi:pyruvate,orthophosphate dikinase